MIRKKRYLVIVKKALDKINKELPPGKTACDHTGLSEMICRCVFVQASVENSILSCGQSIEDAKEAILVTSGALEDYVENLFGDEGMEIGQYIDGDEGCIQEE